jgi:hypothetical protein
MNPELLALLAEIGITAAADTSLWDLTLPLPIKKSSCVSGATYALRTGELVVTLHTRRTSLSLSRHANLNRPRLHPRRQPPAAFTTATFAARNKTLRLAGPLCCH